MFDLVFIIFYKFYKEIFLFVLILYYIIFIVNKMLEVERNIICWYNILFFCLRYWVISDVEFKYFLFEKFSYIDRVI